MKKTGIIIAGIIVAGCFTSINAQTTADPGQAPTVGSGYAESKMIIQTNYNEMYRSLPQDIQNRIQSAAMTIENIRMKTPLESQNYLTTERARAEEFIKTSISQMSLSEMLKTQVDDARKDANAQINERMNEMKARRAAHR
jgi:hypothetical protein